MTRHFTKDDTELVNKHGGGGPPSFTMREMQSETAKQTYELTTWVIIKKTD